MQPGKSHDIPPPTHCPGMWALIHPLKGEFMSMNSLQMCLELTSLSFSTSFPFMFLSLLYFLSPPFHASQIVLKKSTEDFAIGLGSTFLFLVPGTELRTSYMQVQ